MKDKKKKTTKDNKHNLKVLIAEMEKSKKIKNLEEMRGTMAEVYDQAKTSEFSTSLNSSFSFINIIIK